MKQSIRLLAALAAALLVSACSTVPYDEAATSSPSYAITNNVPEAGPLTSGAATYAAPQQAYQQPQYQPPVATPPPATQPYAYNPPEQANDAYAGDASAYDYADNGPEAAVDNGGDTYDYAAGASNPGQTYAATPASNSYEYPSSPTVNDNDTYTSYSGAPAPTANYSNDNYADAGNGGGNNYYASTNNNYAAPSNSGGNLGNASGKAAVQLFASGSLDKAEQIRSAMASRGLNAVVDTVDGLYKVRVPFGSETEARANLMRVRSTSGESGAFFTFR